jgi:hypothetical protein
MSGITSPELTVSKGAIVLVRLNFSITKIAMLSPLTKALGRWYYEKCGREYLLDFDLGDR